jgi:homoserine O-succinyltransferase
VELLDFEDVTYWDELSRIYDWTQTHVQSTMNICWGAQAALYHFHKVPKHPAQRRRFGVYRHRNLKPAIRPTSAASRMISRFPSHAGPRTTALTCRRTRASKC